MKLAQRHKIIMYIRKKGSITTSEAYTDLGITQFATMVKELKEEGYKFETTWERKRNREGKIIKFKRYYLSKQFY